MQTSATSQDVAIPAPPAPPAPVIVQGGSGGARTTIAIAPSGFGVQVPRTREEYRALESRQKEVGGQLTSAANRRKNVALELEKATDPANQSGLQQRLLVLDGRVARLEGELDEVGRALAAAPLSALPHSSTQSVSDVSPGEAARIVAVVVPTSLFFVLAMTALMLWWKRAKRTVPESRTKAELDRLDRLEAAVETIAVEMERVSEGQRFVTRLLTEGRNEAPAFGATSRGEPLRVPASGERGAS